MASKVSEPLQMTSSIPWFLVLEALGHIKQVDPTLLVELIKKTPDISDELGSNAREVVSLRILENLYNGGICNANNCRPPSGSQITFDPSDLCENVLYCILQGASTANLKLGGPEILKWDIDSFIKHKRAQLPRCSLLKLKDRILEKSNPLLALLKDRSGLVVTNESQSGVPLDGGDSNGIAHKPEESSINTQIVEPNQGPDSLITEKEDDVLQEVSLDRNLLPAKRCRGVTVAENCEDTSQSTDKESPKKLKQDIGIMKNVHETAGSMQQNGVSADSSAGIVEHIREEGCDLEKDPQIRHHEESSSREDHHHEGDASTSLTLNNGASSTKMMHCQRKVHNGKRTVPGETSGEGNNIVGEAKGNTEGSSKPAALSGNIEDLVQVENHADEANNNLGDNFQQNAADGGKAKGGEEHCNRSEILSDCDDYHDERIDIATKKNIFLSSQCTYSEDSLATQRSICLKCNKNGHLLVCSSDTCPLVVHESCLGFTAHFDGSGSFYCPFCAYSQAISEYLEAKKKTSLARKDLAAFIGLGVEGQVKKSTTRSDGSKQNRSRLDVKLYENNGANNKENSLNEVNYAQCLPHLSDRLEAEPSRLCPSGNLHCVEKEADVTTDPHHLRKKVRQSARWQGKEQPARHIVQKSDGDISHHIERETSNRNERLHQISEQKVVSHQSDPPHETKCSGTEAEESSEEESEKDATSRYSIRFREQKNKYAYPAIPQLRRKKLPWTKLEEKTLKEGVQKCTSEHDKNIPWKKILEFGGDVFQKGRTSIDLKDKWRNMCRASPRSK